MTVKQLVSAFFTITTLTGCGPSVEELQHAEHSQRLTKLASAYFGSEITAGTFGKWRVTSVANDSKNPFSDKIVTINVTLELPREAADDIMSRGREGQHRAVGWNACPVASNSLWREFTGNDFLIVQAARNGTVFNDTDCRQWRMPGLPQ